MELDRLRHIGNNMPGLLTCDDGTRWHPVELLPLASEAEALRQHFAKRDAEIGDLKKINKTLRANLRMSEWKKDEVVLLEKIKKLEQQLAELRLTYKKMILRSTRQNEGLREQVKLYEQALLASWPQGASGEALDFWTAARKPKP